MSKTELESPSVFDDGTLSSRECSAPGAPWRLVDMHCHLDRMANAAEVAAEAERRGVAILCTTVMPAEALEAQKALARHRNVRVAVGLHPWRVSAAAARAAGDMGESGPAACAAELVDAVFEHGAASNYIGEIGLDFSAAHMGTAAAQVDAFERIVSLCAVRPSEGRIVSIHAVRSAGTALDILERHGLPRRATCIFHWFSGTSDDLARIRRLGCHISVNERMLASKRGREYARQIPLAQLHLETDAPPQLDAPYPARELERSLVRTLEALARVRGVECEELAAHMAQTSSRLLDM